jgi:hypothetical protein
MRRVTKPESMIAFTLSPRDCIAWLLPLLRVRGYLPERIRSGGPKGIHNKEWPGIRPSNSAVCRISPIRLNRCALDAGRILYFGCHQSTLLTNQRLIQDRTHPQFILKQQNEKHHEA